jgi:hypothetical protein
MEEKAKRRRKEENAEKRQTRDKSCDAYLMLNLIFCVAFPVPHGLSGRVSFASVWATSAGVCYRAIINHLLLLAANYFVYPPCADACHQTRLSKWSVKEQGRIKFFLPHSCIFLHYSPPPPRLTHIWLANIMCLQYCACQTTAQHSNRYATAGGRFGTQRRRNCLNDTSKLHVSLTLRIIIFPNRVCYGNNGSV